MMTTLHWHLRYNRWTRLVFVLLFVTIGLTDLRQTWAQDQVWITPSADELDAVRDDIREAITAMDQVLDRTPDGEAWRRYFLWDELDLAIDKRIGIDVVELANARNRLLPIFTRLADDQAGLERPEVQALRVSVRQHVRQINAMLVRRGPQELEARCQRIAELVSANRWTAEAQSEYLAHLRWLDDHHQPQPTRLVRSNWKNLSALIAADFIRNTTSTSVSDPADVNECIVGTRVIGTGVTTGVGWLEPVASSDGAKLVARFSGVLNSDTVGYNGPVRIYSDGQTQLSGAALLELDDSGLRRLSSEVSASADSQTKAIGTKFKGLLDRIVRKVASRKAAQSKAQANWESSYKARLSFSKRFEEDIIEQVSEGDASFHKYLRLPWLRRDLTPRSWIWHSDDSKLQTDLSFDGRGRPASPVGPPAQFLTFGESSGVQLLIHQSFIDNAAEGYFGGLTQKLSDFSENVKQQAPNEDIQVILDDFHPIRCTLDKDVLRFDVLLKQIVTAGREAGGVIVHVAYRVERNGDAWQLRRVDLPTIEPQPTFSRPSRLSASGSAIRVLVQPRLEAELPETYPLELPPLDVRETGESIPKSVRDLRIANIRALGGWLYISLQ